MKNLNDTLAQIQSDSRYQANLDWGKPRNGHPEGTVRHHIRELEENLSRIENRLSSDEIDKIKIAIHVHDTFKPNAKRGVPISDPNSHASLAKTFLSDFMDDRELLTLIQYHDEPYAIWKKHSNGNNHLSRLEELYTFVNDWDTFLAFQLVDNCTAGKSFEPTEWFFDEIKKEVDSKVTSDWIDLLRH